MTVRKPSSRFGGVFRWKVQKSFPPILPPPTLQRWARDVSIVVVTNDVCDVDVLHFPPRLSKPFLLLLPTGASSSASLLFIMEPMAGTVVVQNFSSRLVQSNICTNCTENCTAAPRTILRPSTKTNAAKNTEGLKAKLPPHDKSDKPRKSSRVRTN